MGNILSGCIIPKIANTENDPQIHQAIASSGFQEPLKVSMCVHDSFPRKTIIKKNISLKI